MTETLYETTVGKVHVKVTAEPDYDFGWQLVSEDIGKFTDERSADAKMPLYYRREDIMRLPNSDLWRDRRGRIAAAPSEDGYSSREYQFIQISDWYNETLSIAFRQADRVEAYESGEWCYLSIDAVAEINGREIGRASLGGVESDSGETYLRQCAREMATEATADTRRWLADTAA